MRVDKYLEQKERKGKQVAEKWVRDADVLLSAREQHELEPYRGKPLACSSAIIMVDSDGTQKRWHPGLFCGALRVGQPTTYPVINPRSLTEEQDYYARKDARKALAKAAALA